MKVRRRLKILLGVLAAVTVLSAALVAADLLPALARMRERRKELERIEAEIQRSLLEVRLRAGEAKSGDVVVPELPEIAAFISTLRKAQDRTGVSGMTFDAVQTERKEVVIAAGVSEETQRYLLSRLTVNFSSSLKQTTELLNLIQSEYPAETFDYLKLSSKSPDRDRVDVSMAVRLYGIPR